MARPPKPPAYLDELAAQQWKAKAKQLAERGDLTPADWNNLELFASTIRCTAKPWKTLPDVDSALLTAGRREPKSGAERKGRR